MNLYRVREYDYITGFKARFDNNTIIENRSEVDNTHYGRAVQHDPYGCLAVHG